MHEIDVLTQHATKTERRNELRMGWEGGGVKIRREGLQGSPSRVKKRTLQMSPGMVKGGGGW